MSKSGTESQSDVPEITVGLLSGVSSIVTKMLKVMEKVHYVQKDGTNSFQNYKYASEAAAIAALRPALVEVGLLLLPSVEKMWMDDNGNTHVELLYRIFDTSGDYIQFKAVGSGNDRNSKGIGDKGVYKALTGASKYALLKTFMMETGDDPEVPREEEKEDKKEVRKEIKKQPLQAVPSIPAAKKEVSDQDKANYSLFVSQMIEWGETCSTEDELSEIWKSNQESIDKLKSPEVSDLYEKLKIQFTAFKAKAKGEV